VFFTPDLSAAAWCNEEDHCRLVAAPRGGADLRGALAALAALTAAVERAATAAGGAGVMRSPALGGLAACPSNLAGGFRAAVTVALPALSRDPARLRALCAAHGLQPRGAAGERAAPAPAPAPVPARWELSNAGRFGAATQAQAQALVDGVDAILLAEEEAAAAAAAAAAAGSSTGGSSGDGGGGGGCDGGGGGGGVDGGGGPRGAAASPAPPRAPAGTSPTAAVIAAAAAGDDDDDEDVAEIAWAGRPAAFECELSPVVAAAAAAAARGGGR
jgi:uncharacterized membrane protein YgcG